MFPTMVAFFLIAEPKFLSLAIAFTFFCLLLLGYLSKQVASSHAFIL